MAEAIRDEPFPNILELDMRRPDLAVGALTRIVEPIRDRIAFGGCSDWNLRRLLPVDPSIRVVSIPSST